eukprot:TRINITY_DN250_c0_g1_i1.p1 TRINITY_DN250_c0_g1~~TRINITY_DN250_c0_g1_i1.p1  ORF type:complete len:374 (-),score=70.76 TRINITY_DN250_c0_g1_i1:95-1216(-)
MDCGIKIYLDNAHTTAVDPDVFKAITPYFRDNFAVPGLPHQPGAAAKTVEEECISNIRKLLSCRPDDRITLTSGGTESCNQVVKSVYFARVLSKSSTTNRHQVISVQFDHPAVLRPCTAVQEMGVPTVYLPCNPILGTIDPASLRTYISPITAIVNISWSSYITGALNPIQEVIKIAHENGALVHIDAVQIVGKLPISFSGLEADYMSLSAHKFHGPKGAGLLISRSNVPLYPLVHGENQQLEGRRGGTVNLVSLVGLTAALTIANASQHYMDTAIRALRDRLEDALLHAVPNIKIAAKDAPRLPNVTFVVLPQGSRSATEVVEALSQRGVYASAHSVPGTMYDQGVRFSLSKETTRPDVESAIAAIISVLRV